MAVWQSGRSKTRAKGLWWMRWKPPISIAEIARRLIMSEKASLPYDTSVRLAVVRAVAMPCSDSASFETVNVDDASDKARIKPGLTQHEPSCPFFGWGSQFRDPK